MSYIDLETAHKLFREAQEFYSGKALYMDERSEIRAIATKVFGNGYTSTLLQVCNQIFYVLACEFMDLPA